MALAGAVARAVFRTAVAVLRSSSTAVGEGQLARRLIDIHGQQAGQRFQAYQAIARQAIRATNAANQMDRSPTGVFGANNLPVDPSLDRGSPRFNYRILVTVEDRATGHQVKYAIDAQSDVARSLDNIRQEAQAQFANWADYKTKRDEIARLGPDVAVSVEILAAGRRA